MRERKRKVCKERGKKKKTIRSNSRATMKRKITQDKEQRSHIQGGKKKEEVKQKRKKGVRMDHCDAMKPPEQHSTPQANYSYTHAHGHPCQAVKKKKREISAGEAQDDATTSNGNGRER